MPYVVAEVEVEVDLESFDDDQIIEEYELRMLGERIPMKEALNEIYQLRRLGKPYENQLNNLICDALGVVA